jgi:hypothetical protein
MREEPLEAQAWFRRLSPDGRRVLLEARATRYKLEHHERPAARAVNGADREAGNVSGAGSVATSQRPADDSRPVGPLWGVNGSTGLTGPASELVHGPRWEGESSGYQAAAADALWIEQGRTVQAWDWISPDCADVRCLDVEHLLVKAPLLLHYPAEVCVYCGDRADQRDHLLPEPLTGKAHRRHVLTVPACGPCNRAISDYPSACITDRRRVALRAMCRRHLARLATRDWRPEEVGEFEGRLREHVTGAMGRKAALLARLAWPDDPSYDLRALQQSGIEDPYATGLL